MEDNSCKITISEKSTKSYTSLVPETILYTYTSFSICSKYCSLELSLSIIEGVKCMAGLKA